MVRLTIGISLIVALFANRTFAQADTCNIQASDLGHYQELLRMGSGSISSMAWQPNSSSLAVGGSLGIWVYPSDLDNGVLFASDAHSVPSNGVQWSPDGSVVASANEDGSITIWSVENPASPLYEFTGEHTETYAISWSPDGRYLASSGATSVAVWEIDSRQRINHYPISNGHFARPVAWSPTENKVASIQTDYKNGRFVHRILIWDIISESSIYTEYLDSEVFELAWLPDGNILISLDTLGNVSLWNAQTGETVFDYPLNEAERISAFTPSPSGDSMALSITRRVNNLRTPQTVHQINLWNIATNQVTTLVQDLDYPITHLAWSGDKIAGATYKDQSLRIWNSMTGETISATQAHTNQFGEVAWSPDGSLLASTSNGDLRVRLWNSITGEQEHIFNDPQSYSVAWSPDSAFLAASTLANELHILSVASYSIVRTLPGMDTDRLIYLDEIMWSPDGSMIAGATSNNYVLLWDVNATQSPRVLQRGDDIAWSPDGSKLAVMTSGQPADRITGQVSIWDRVIEETIEVLDNVEGRVSAAWSKEGDRLAIATANSSESRISIFDVASQTIISTYSDGHVISSIDWVGNCLAYNRIAEDRKSVV